MLHELDEVVRADHRPPTNKGRVPALTPEQTQHARRLTDEGVSISAIARTLGCSRSAVYRAFDREELSRPTVAAELAALRQFKLNIEALQQELDQKLAGERVAS